MLEMELKQARRLELSNRAETVKVLCVLGNRVVGRSNSRDNCCTLHISIAKHRTHSGTWSSRGVCENSMNDDDRFDDWWCPPILSPRGKGLNAKTHLVWR